MKSTRPFIRKFGMGRVLILVAAFLVALLLMCCAVLYLMSDEDYRTALIWSAGLIYETELEIDGAFAIDFGRKSQLKAEEIRLKANDGSYVLSLGSIHIEQNVDAYIETGTLWISRLRLTDLSVDVLESKSEEEIDWQGFSIPSVVLEKLEIINAALTYTESDQQKHRFKLSYLEIDESDKQSPIKIRAAGMVKARPLKLDGTLGSLAKLHDMQVEPGKTFPIDFSLHSGSADGEPASKSANIAIIGGSVGRTPTGDGFVEFTFDVVLSELAEIINNEVNDDKLGHLQGLINLTDTGDHWHIKKIELASSGTDLYQFNLDGAVDGLHQDARVELQSELSVPSPEILGRYLGIDLSGYAPYTSKGRLSGDKNQLSYKGNNTIGRIESEVTLSASLKNNKPLIQGELNIPVIYLSDIGINQVEIEQTAPLLEAPPVENKRGLREMWKKWRKKQKPSTDNKAPLFDREPMDFANLQAVDLDLSIQIDQIEGIGYTVDQVRGELKLNDGVLRISPLEFAFERGASQLQFEMDTREIPVFSLNINSEDLVLGELIAQLQSEIPIKGRANLMVDLTSRGRSTHELASALSGTLRFSLDDASLPSKYIELLSVDVFGWVLRKGTLGSTYTPVDCILMDFDIDQGLATSKLLIADGPTLSVTGTTTVDLGEETMDMVLLPKQKKRIYSTMPPIKIYGPLRSPVVKALPKTAAVTTIAGTVLLPAVFIPSYMVNKFLKRGASTSSGCANFIAVHSAQ